MIAGALKAKCYANHRESRPYSWICPPEVLRFEDIVVGEPGDEVGDTAVRHIRWVLADCDRHCGDATRNVCLFNLRLGWLPRRS